MKLVILDGHALNPGDLSWGGIERLTSCTIYDRTPPELVIERAGDAELVLTNKTIMNRPLLEKLPQLRYIGVLATGVNVVDLDFAREQGITVTNVPGYGTPSVAQMVFALLLELTMQVGHHSELVRNGAWSRSPDFSFWERPLVELRSDHGNHRFRPNRPECRPHCGSLRHAGACPYPPARKIPARPQQTRSRFCRY